jgi:hypothetical protein
MANAEPRKTNVLAIFLLLAFLVAAYVGYTYRTQRDYYRQKLDTNNVQYPVPSDFRIAPKR